jgi:hypothetical protein
MKLTTLSSAEVKYPWSCTATSHLSSRRGASLSTVTDLASSSSALQPGVGFGLLKKNPSIRGSFEGVATMIVLRGGGVNPTPNP